MEPDAPGPQEPPAPEPRELLLADLVLDPNNRRRRTPRSARMLTASLEQVGPARSIVIDEHNEVIAGNGVVEAAADLGLNRVRVVEADGDTIIAVRRRGLSPEDKRALAIYDNRTAELAEWDGDQLAADREQGWPLAPFFAESELKKHLRDPRDEPQVKPVDVSTVRDQFWIAIRGPLAAQAQALERLRALMADLDGVDVQLGTVEQSEAWTG